jgi:hypothetical protein
MDGVFFLLIWGFGGLVVGMECFWVGRVERGRRKGRGEGKRGEGMWKWKWRWDMGIMLIFVTVERQSSRRTDQREETAEGEGEAESCEGITGSTGRWRKKERAGRGRGGWWE